MCDLHPAAKRGLLVGVFSGEQASMSTIPRRQAQSERQSASLAALAITLLLVVLGLYLTEALRDEASVQDCVLSGRTLCEAALP